MNKKQAVIILTLLALIVCAGVYAAKINSSGNLYVNGDTSDNNTSSTSTTDKNSTTTIFDQLRLTRTQSNNNELINLRTIMDSKDALAETKADATAKYNDLTKAIKYCSDIEAGLKLKGFEDVICTVSSDNSRVDLVIKNKDAKLTAQQKKDIEYVVINVSNIKNFSYEVRQ